MDPLVKHPQGFSFGLTPIVASDSASSNLNFGILRLQAGQKHDVTCGLEIALTLFHGQVKVQYAHRSTSISRTSLFDDAPLVIHLSSEQICKIIAITNSEFAVVSTENELRFSPMIFDGRTIIENDHRGRGLLNDTAYRLVRTVFDKRNRPDSNLVLGEVITFPGRWSSYPPHHHVQPEIYHYRFSETDGYGYGELGDNVYKIKQYDTLKIFNDQTHAQVSAPGYAMYYLWAIRHLPDNPYINPTFVDEHAWTKEKTANERVWSCKN